MHVQLRAVLPLRTENRETENSRMNLFCQLKLLLTTSDHQPSAKK